MFTVFNSLVYALTLWKMFTVFHPFTDKICSLFFNRILELVHCSSTFNYFIGSLFLNHSLYSFVLYRYKLSIRRLSP